MSSCVRMPALAFALLLNWDVVDALVTVRSPPSLADGKVGGHLAANLPVNASSFAARLKAGQGYSNEGQDQWVLSVLGAATPTQPRKFLDIGARDGDFFSNTRRLEEQGWTGVCIEPFPTNFQQYGRTCQMVQKALVAQANAQRIYSNCEDGSGITGHSGFTNENKNPQAQAGCTRTVVPQTTYAELPLPAGTLDYVSLDVEGVELELVRAFPFHTHCARLWTIEHAHMNPEIQATLSQHGCNLVKVGASDGFFQCNCP